VQKEPLSELIGTVTTNTVSHSSSLSYVSTNHSYHRLSEFYTASQSILTTTVAEEPPPATRYPATSRGLDGHLRDAAATIYIKLGSGYIKTHKPVTGMLFFEERR
jgi:hypothetical protein